MSRVIKSLWVSQSDHVVKIPDAKPLAFVSEDGSGPAGGLSPEAYGAIVEQARDEGRLFASQIVQQATQEKEAILSQAQRDAELLRLQAWQEGIQQGLDEKREEIENCITEVCMQVASLCADHEGYMQEYEHELKGFAVDIAEKVLTIKIGADSLILEKLVAQAVRSVRGADWISVEVSDKLPELVEHLERELAHKDFGSTRVEVAGVDLPPGDVVLQTSEGVVDASVSTQLRSLREMFQEMDQQPEGLE